MEKSGKPYAEALKEAQQKGYAETNPDVGRERQRRRSQVAAAEPGRFRPAASSRERLGARVSKTFMRSIFVTPGAPARARSNSSPWPSETGERCKFLFHRRWCRGRIFSPDIDGATNAICFAGKKQRRRRAASAIATMFWSAREPAAVPPPWRCSATSASWRAARRSFCGAPSLVTPGTLKLQAEDEIDGSFYRPLRRQGPRRNRRRHRPDFWPHRRQYFGDLAAATQRRGVAWPGPEL